MAQVQLRFYAELNDFLAPALRQKEIWHSLNRRLKFRSSFYPLFSAASVALQSLKTQRFKIKLKDLHKQALNVCVNCLHY
ncbi:hypothetical protein [Thiolapillus sp.]|uniref:hypothetical protein n=1 Tax=Thiolapillus sp. TaxID=2017437 RepID=UPI003AF87C1E